MNALRALRAAFTILALALVSFPLVSFACRRIFGGWAGFWDCCRRSNTVDDVAALARRDEGHFRRTLSAQAFVLGVIALIALEYILVARLLF